MAYTGPGDIVSGASVFYGLRGYTAAYASPGTNNAIRLTDGSATQDIVILPSGDLDVATASTFLSGHTGVYIDRLYDQTGGGALLINNGNTAITNSLVLNFINGHPAIKCIHSANGSFTTSSTSPAVAQPFTISTVVQRQGSFSSNNLVLSSASSPYMNLNIAASQTMQLSPGTTALTATITDSVTHIVQAVYNNTSSVLNIDNTEVTGGAGTVGITANTLWVGNDAFNDGSLDGYILEIGIWPSAFTSGNRSSMYSNQNAYWFGTASSCIIGSRMLLGVGCGIWAAKKIEENPILTRRSLLIPRRGLIGHNGGPPLDD